MPHALCNIVLGNIHSIESTLYSICVAMDVCRVRSRTPNVFNIRTFMNIYACVCVLPYTINMIFFDAFAVLSAREHAGHFIQFTLAVCVCVSLSLSHSTRDAVGASLWPWWAHFDHIFRRNEKNKISARSVPRLLRGGFLSAVYTRV